MRVALLDVNVLLAILLENHAHSQAARIWLDARDEPSSLAVCRLAQIGALRLLTRTAVMGESVLSASDAWNAVNRVAEDDRFEFRDEPDGFEEAWRSVCLTIPHGSTAETDAYLAAFALAADLDIATFDRGMARFAGVRIIDPSIA